MARLWTPTWRPYVLIVAFSWVLALATCAALGS